jgi:C_GCAxxG_C_C family probable redox protein
MGHQKRQTFMKEATQKRAFDYFVSGFHCAESVSMAIVEVFAEKRPPELPAMASGFVRGVGRTQGELCGALSGGVIALGHLFGRTKPREDIDELTQLVTEYRNRFSQTFGSSRCQDLLDRFGTQTDWDKCKQMTGEAAGLLAEILMEHNARRSDSSLP